MNTLFTRFRNFVKSQFSGLPCHDRIYKFSGWIVIAYVATGVFVQVVFDQKALNYVAELSLKLLGASLAAAVLAEHWSFIKPIVKHKLAQLAGAAIAFLVYQHAEIKADHFINGYTGVDPGQLGDAATLLAALYLPYSWAVTITGLLTLVVMVEWIRVPSVALQKSNSPAPVLKWFGRIIGLMTIVIFTEGLITKFDQNDSWAARSAQRMILATEYFSASPCLQTGGDLLVAEIGSKRLSVYDEATQEFTAIDCEIGSLES